MRILISSYWTCPLTRLGVLTSGGMNVYIFNLANELEKRNIHADIYTRVHKGKHDPVIYLSEKIRLIHVPIKESDDYLGTKTFAEAINKYISDKKLKYDLIHSHYYYSGLTGIILKKHLKIPLVNSFHTLGEMKKIYAGIIDKKRISAEKEIVDSADYLIASTELEKDELLIKYGASKSKIKVINPGVDHRKFSLLSKQQSRRKLKLKDKTNYILFVGRIDPVKGISMLLEAVCRLNKENPQFKNKNKLLIIGGDIKETGNQTDFEASIVNRFIVEKKLNQCTEFLGSISHNKLSLYYTAADIVVMPSVYESFGLVILEAMSCGSCVLASGVGGLKYLVKDNENGILFKNNDINDLSFKLKLLLENSKLRKYLGQNAFLQSQKYSWSRSADNVLALYSKLINNS